MPKRVLFVMGLHSHQPVGNFDFVFEQATKDCYHPFLEVLARYPKIRMSLHYSGVLLEWLRLRRPETFALLVRLVESGQVEMMGGGFDEPILVMLPERDQVGQMKKQSDYLARHFGVRPEGMWLTERVWETGLVKTIAEAGLRYTALDDTHFKFAGLSTGPLNGYYLTEDQGRLLNLFPMDELLRYYVPFQAPEKTVEHLRAFADESGTSLATYADDGEKFGSWPHTFKHVYTDGWLERFFQALVQNADWIEILTFAEALKRVPPKGQVWLPDASYREMMEWVLPVKPQHDYDDLVKELKEKQMWERSKFFVKGGFWRSFRTKYSEANEMYAKMWLVSDKVAAMPEPTERRETALDELYQGQCNCPYWHGVFGGLYLPHLRYAIYQHLIRAENLADEELRGKRAWCDSQIRDYNFDGRDEVLLASPHLSLYLVPHRGGHLAELDVRAKAFNPLAVLTRREEAYHRKVLRKAEQAPGAAGTASIHDLVLFKTEGLDRMLQVDPYKREGLIDHVLALDTTPEQFARVEHAELGDFVEGEYAVEVSKRRNLQRVTLTRQGAVWSGPERVPLTVRKEVSLGATQGAFTVGYELTGPPDRSLTVLFGVEMAYAMLAAHADDRWYYTDARENRRGELATRLDVPATTRFGLVDGWQQLDIALAFSQSARVWAFPLETVSQSEAGFEAVYQASIVLALWLVELKNGESWKVAFDEAHLAL